MNLNQRNSKNEEKKKWSAWSECYIRFLWNSFNLWSHCDGFLDCVQTFVSEQTWYPSINVGVTTERDNGGRGIWRLRLTLKLKKNIKKTEWTKNKRLWKKKKKKKKKGINLKPQTSSPHSWTNEHRGSLPPYLCIPPPRTPSATPSLNTSKRSSPSNPRWQKPRGQQKPSAKTWRRSSTDTRFWNKRTCAGWEGDTWQDTIGLPLAYSTSIMDRKLKDMKNE